MQFFGQEEIPKAKLIQFTTFDGKIRKGALLPEIYSPEGSFANGSADAQKIIVPINQCLEIITRLVSYTELDCSASLKIFNDRHGFKFVLPTSRQTGGYIFLDSDVLRYVKDNNFASVSNKMVAFCTHDNLQNLLDVLGKKLKISAELSPKQFKQIEDNFKVSAKLDDEIKAIEKHEQPQETDDRNRKVKLAKAKLLLAKARLKLALV